MLFRSPTSNDLPKKTPEEIEAEVRLKRARTKKLVAETFEVADNAKAERKRRMAAADKNTAAADDLRDKHGADFRGVDYWKSVIIKNLRKPVGRGKSSSERAASLLKQLEMRRSYQRRATEDAYDDAIKTQEGAVSSVRSKRDAFVKEYGETPTEPTAPDKKKYTTSKDYNSAIEKYNKEKQEYEDNVKAKKVLDAKVREAEESLYNTKEKKQQELADMDNAFDDLVAPIESKAGLPPAPKREKQKNPTPKSYQGEKPASEEKPQGGKKEIKGI